MTNWVWETINVFRKQICFRAIISLEDYISFEKEERQRSSFPAVLE